MDVKPPGHDGTTPPHHKGLRNEGFSVSDGQPALSAELDWMLESRQASPSMLAEALVRDYYPEIFRLLLALMDDAPAARRAARLTFSAALLDLSNYRFTEGVRSWLYFHALKAYQRLRPGLSLSRSVRAALPGSWAGAQVRSHSSTRVEVQTHRDPSSWQEASIWLAIDALDERSRQTVILSYLFDWPLTVLAGTLQVNESQLAFYRERAHLKLFASLAKDGFTLQDLPEHDLETALRAALQARTPPIDPDLLDLQALIASLGNRADHQLTRRRSSGALKEVVWVGLAILLVAGLMYRANLLVPENQSNREMIFDTPTPVPYLVPQSQLLTFAYMVELGDTLASIGEGLGIAPARLAEMNRLATNMNIQPGQSLLVLIPLATSGPSPTPIPPVAHRADFLSEHSSDTDIRSFLSLSERFWNTLWLDAVYTQYGPVGYVGPPQSLRYQAYVSHDEQRLELSMDFTGRQAGVVLTSGGLQYGVTSYSGSAYIESAEPANFFRSEWDKMIFPSHSSWMQNDGTFQVLGSAEIAGRKTVVVEWQRATLDEQDYPPRRLRLWIDAATGIVLRLQHYSDPGASTLLEDLTVTEFLVDGDFPRSSQYDPRTLLQATPAPNMPNGSAKPTEAGINFPSKLSTGHDHLDKVAPPAGFTASASALTFQYPLANSSPLQSQGVYSVELFAGGYFLNTVEMPDPWTIRCERSPDGTRLAFIDGSATVARQTKLTWLSLLPPYRLKFPALDIDPYSFAFAPDSHRMAVWGMRKDGSVVGELYVIDLDSGAAKKLAEMWRADSLVWSPDGRYLGLVVWGGGWFQPQVQVIDVNNRQVIYRTPIDYHSLWIGSFPNWPAPDWPGHTWGVKFPQMRNGLESCTQP